MMFLSSRGALVVALAVVAVVHAADDVGICPDGNKDTCGLKAYNPIVCGDNFNCGYDSFCLAETAGYTIEEDCCQAPRSSSCGFDYNPVLCGSRQCPYDNLCLAGLAGYSEDKCTSVPKQVCPVIDEPTACGSSPTNPLKCGGGYTCKYDTLCGAKTANFTGDDCCQDTRYDTTCTMEMAPVNCGPPQENCPYDNVCLAKAAGYDPDTQCCPAAQEDANCANVINPIQCRNAPDTCAMCVGKKPLFCEYSNACIAESAGWTAAGCCRILEEEECTVTDDDDDFPQICGDQGCYYESEDCATKAGFDLADCCKAPKETGSCTMEEEKVVCGNKDCIYPNLCVANLAGFEDQRCAPCEDEATCCSPNSQTDKCKATTQSGTPTGSSAAADLVAVKKAGAILLSLLALLLFT